MQTTVLCQLFNQTYLAERPTLSTGVSTPSARWPALWRLIEQPEPHARSSLGTSMITSSSYGTCPQSIQEVQLRIASL